jgi:hypothetical protein
MPYSLKTYDGTSLVTIADGSVDDQVSTSLFLIGKNVTSYGTRQNENFLYLLENFASTTAPEHKMIGQTWFDKSANSLKVYDGTIWRGLAVSQTSATQPTNLKLGDFWFDSANKQIWVKTSATAEEFILVGPEVTTGFGVTKLVSKSIKDINDTAHAVINISVDDDVLGIYSKDAFSIGGNEAEFASGFTSLVRGLTLKDGASIRGLDIPSRTNAETINTQWNFSSGIKLGSNSSVASDSNGNLVLNSGVNNVIVNGTSLVPYSVNTTVGSNLQPFDAVYTNAVTSGSALKELEFLGDIVIGTNSKIRPFNDNNVILGSTASRWKNFFTYQVSSGNETNIGTLEGDWRLTTNSKLTSKYLSTIFLTSGSVPAVGTIQGQWLLGSGSTWQATALIDGNGNTFLPDENSTINTIAKRTGTGQIKATEFLGPLRGAVTGDVTGNVTGNTSGTHTGPVVGAVTGNVTGNTAGTHTGPVVGNITGNITGNVTGNTAGTHTGPVTGAVAGNVTGNVTGNTAGTHTGPVVGNVLGNLTGDILASNGTKILDNGDGTDAVFTGRVVGNVTGNLYGDVYATTVFTTDVAATLVSSARFYPTAGSSNGIRFPNDPGGGSGDTAWISYYAVSGEKTVLEIGVANDPSGSIQDSLYLNAVGGVGVKTQSPRYALDVNGDIGCNALHGVADNSVLWNGSNKFISTSPPTNDQGVDGDFWFQREA